MTDRTLPTRTYYLVFIALIALTFLTVGLSFLDLGNWHTPVGAAIALGKASLVALFFMHLLHGSRLNWLALAAGLFWLGILLALSLADYSSRGWGIRSSESEPRDGIRAPAASNR
jgi:cytochrome c oxidase subunit IV